VDQLPSLDPEPPSVIVQESVQTVVVVPPLASWYDVVVVDPPVSVVEELQLEPLPLPLPLPESIVEPLPEPTPDPLAALESALITPPPEPEPEAPVW